MDSTDWSVCCERHLGEKGKGAHVAALVKVTEYRKATLRESQANRSSVLPKPQNSRCLAGHVTTMNKDYMALPFLAAMRNS